MIYELLRIDSFVLDFKMQLTPKKSKDEIFIEVCKVIYYLLIYVTNSTMQVSHVCFIRQRCD